MVLKHLKHIQIEIYCRYFSNFYEKALVGTIVKIDHKLDESISHLTQYFVNESHSYGRLIRI